MPGHPVRVNADFETNPIIAGLEWNVQDHLGQIGLTWWITWFDQGLQTWKAGKTTKKLLKESNHDYFDFYNSFNGSGFSLLINLAQGGKFPRVFNPDYIHADGRPQHMHIHSVKVYGFS